MSDIEITALLINMDHFIDKMIKQDGCIVGLLEEMKANFPMSDDHYYLLKRAVEYALPAGGKGKPLDVAEAKRLVMLVLNDLKAQIS